ncbi:MAG: Enoyl-CoA hydratase/isomerase [bacterium]|nr:Enoyl-CoA hydratase/isomerase [bacterium]
MSVRYEVAERIATITIDRPDVKNALGPDEWKALRARVDDAAADGDVRVVVVTGAGGTFSAGGDLKTMPERLAEPRDVRKANLVVLAQIVPRLRELDKPVIAMIDGACVGAGLSLALACDIRIASARAKLGAAFHRVGLTGDFGLLWMLPRIVGPTQAMDLLMRAETIDAARAEAIGLVTRVVDGERLADETYDYARRLADGPPVAQGFTKRGLHRALESELGAMLEWEADAQAICSHTADAHEGVNAFLERRKPIFRGS